MVVWKSFPSDTNFLYLEAFEVKGKNNYSLFNDASYSYSYKLNLDLDIDLRDNFSLKLLYRSECLSISTSIEEILHSLNGVYLKNIKIQGESEVIECETNGYYNVLHYCPFSGETYSANSDNYNSSCQKQYISLSRIDNEDFALYVDLINFKDYQILIVPCNLLVLAMEHGLHEFGDINLLLEKIGIQHDSKRGYKVPENRASYAFIKIVKKRLKDKSKALMIEDAILVSNCSISDTHVSFSFIGENWYRILKSDALLWTVLVEIFEAEEVEYRPESLLKCSYVEELKYGFASIQNSDFGLTLMNYYNLKVLDTNQHDRHFLYFSPKIVNNECFVIAVRRVLKDAPNYYGYRIEHYWNIYSITKQQWLFKKYFPEGMAVWRENGELVIGGVTSDTKSVISLNEALGSILDLYSIDWSIISMMSFELTAICQWISKRYRFDNSNNSQEYFELESESQLEESEKRRINSIISNYLLYSNMKRSQVEVMSSIELLPTSLIKYFKSVNHANKSYYTEYYEEEMHVKTLDSMNQHGLDEIREMDSDFPYD